MCQTILVIKENIAAIRNQPEQQNKKENIQWFKSPYRENCRHL